MKRFRKVLKADCTLLLNRFQQSESVRFEAFSQAWRDMKFEHIFYGAVRHESRSFGRLILDTAYEFLLPPFTFQIRVGGLYLLYALFHCQSANPPEQIRMALKDWEEVLKFEKDSLEAQHFDVVYVLRKLLHDKAFVFAAMPQLLQFERKQLFQCRQLCESFVEKPSAPQTLINNDLLEELSNVHSLYENLKSSIRAESESESESGLNLAQQNLVPKLKGTVLDFYSWQQDKFTQGGPSREEDCGEGTSTQQESSRRADLLASIKSQAYGEASEVSKSRRHRAVEMGDETKHEADPSTVSKYERRKRRTLKYRVTNNITVTGDVWKDILTDTNIHHLTSLQSDDKPPRSFKKFRWKMEKD